MAFTQLVASSGFFLSACIVARRRAVQITLTSTLNRVVVLARALVRALVRTFDRAVNRLFIRRLSAVLFKPAGQTVAGTVATHTVAIAVVGAQSALALGAIEARVAGAHTFKALAVERAHVFACW